MDYTAVIIDVVNSKKYNNREEIQTFLKDTVRYCNLLYAKSIKKELMFGAGDEIQGLFIDSAAAYLCVRMFTMLCYPVKIRAGLGQGAIDYDSDYWTSAESDGTAYHFARDAINISENMGSFSTVFHAGKDRDKLVNALLLSSQLLQQGQSGTCQLVKLVSEFIYPFYDPESMTHLNKESSLLNGILVQKLSLATELNLSIDCSEFAIQISKSNPDTIYVNLQESISRDNILIAEQWKKGIATKAAAILGTSRQNVEKHIRLGKVIENRNIDAAIVLFLMEEKGV